MDAALGLEDSSKKEETVEDASAGDAAGMDMEDNLDLESFGKKKKKKKKPFNLEELDGALPKDGEEGNAGDEKSAEAMDDDINLDMDFSTSKKKKKTKKKDLDELFADKKGDDEDRSEDKENGGLK